MFLMWPFLTAEHAPPVVAAIARHAARVVYLSSAGVRDGVERQADPINQFHAEVERLIEDSGLEWTFVRAGSFAANALGRAESIRTDVVVREPYGAARKAPIHERDVAEVAVRALTADGLVGARPTLTGPESLTLAEQVAVVGEVLGVRMSGRGEGEAVGDGVEGFLDAADQFLAAAGSFPLPELLHGFAGSLVAAGGDPVLGRAAPGGEREFAQQS